MAIVVESNVASLHVENLVNNLTNKRQFPLAAYHFMQATRIGNYHWKMT